MREHDAVEEETREVTGPGILSRAAGVARSAKDAALRTTDVVTGADIRRFDEFTAAATTVVVGLHRDQAALSEQFEELSQRIDEARRDQIALNERYGELSQTVANVRRDVAELTERTVGVESVQPKQAELIGRNRREASQRITVLGAVSLAALVVGIVSLVLGAL